MGSISSICEPAPDTRPAKQQQKLTVYGDYYNSDTRTLLSILKLAGEPHDYVNMNTLQNEHRERESVY
jgi:hypothetical protein